MIGPKDIVNRLTEFIIKGVIIVGISIAELKGAGCVK